MSCLWLPIRILKVLRQPGRVAVIGTILKKEQSLAGKKGRGFAGGKDF